MFHVRDYSVFLPSPNAERQFRIQRLLDHVIRGLILVLLALCVWNIATLVQLRNISSQDLADVRSITDDLSTRLIWMVTLLTIALIAAREWVAGISTMGLLIPLTILLTLVLVPAAMTEIQPPLRDQTLRVVMNECPPKAIVNDRLSSMGRCTPRSIHEGEVLLAGSDPAEGTFETIEASGGGQNTIAFTMAGRGEYTVYFMFQYEDMAACEDGAIFPRNESFSAGNYQCVQHDGHAWMVMPHTTAGNMPSGIHLIQVAMP